MRSAFAFLGLSSLVLGLLAGCGAADAGSDSTDEAADPVVACPMIACPAGSVRDPVTCECTPVTCDPLVCLLWQHWDSNLCKCVPNSCVQTQLCVAGSHWDSTLCKCVPDPVSCGGATCASGEYCCNASCGICEPLGSVCPQIACQ